MGMLMEATVPTSHRWIPKGMNVQYHQKATTSLRARARLDPPDFASITDGTDVVVPESGGAVRGKAALREYWTTALANQPDLQFGVVGVYRGESTLVINYRNHRGELVNEVLTFDGVLVRVGHGTYLG